MPSFPQLEGDLQTNVLIIGGALIWDAHCIGIKQSTPGIALAMVPGLMPTESCWTILQLMI